ncbi:MAG: hypothetical protein J7507_05200 [Pseudoxanthomonas sp.]|nr:hypothetical protein [Pseudoxanthomonas sp.]
MRCGVWCGLPARRPGFRRSDGAAAGASCRSSRRPSPDECLVRPGSNNLAPLLWPHFARHPGLLRDDDSRGFLVAGVFLSLPCQRLAPRAQRLDDRVHVVHAAGPGAAADFLQRGPQPGVIGQARMRGDCRMQRTCGEQFGSRGRIEWPVRIVADEVDAAFELRAVDLDADDVAIAQLAERAAGPLLGRLLGRMHTPLPDIFASTDAPASRELPGAWPSFVIALLPVLLITLSVVADGVLADGALKSALLFAGAPTIALLIAVLVAFWWFGVRRGIGFEVQTRWLNAAISGIAAILLIITAGGVFKQVLVDSGTGDMIARLSQTWHMPPLVFAWLVTAVLRVMIGSATVAGITAAGVVAPLLGASGVSPELAVLAVGAGSVFGSHVNDSGFWMFKEFFGLTMKQTFLSWTVMETTISIVGLAGVLLLEPLVG